ncbi:hypothetical protein PF005_g22676 [Phytophthora fragariae]|uniref:Uncharacterized protein n=1 Tax=Phytophthora fragariae TaxID=53985 RepID=A0A6A3WBH2_9STRA|nr:hypothetical protein PF005_g22676 [Phytophthora fragariae]
MVSSIAAVSSVTSAAAVSPVPSVAAVSSVLPVTVVPPVLSSSRTGVSCCVRSPFSAELSLSWGRALPGDSRVPPSTVAARFPPPLLVSTHLQTRPLPASRPACSPPSPCSCSSSRTHAASDRTGHSSCTATQPSVARSACSRRGHSCSAPDLHVRHHARLRSHVHHRSHRPRLHGRRYCCSRLRLDRRRSCCSHRRRVRRL